MEITTVGLDIAKRVFQLHGVDAAGKAVFGGSYSVPKCWRSSRLYLLVWLALRLAARRIIGRVRSGNWGMRCD